MREYFEYLSNFVHKVGKRNIALVLAIVIVLVISKLYSTFSLSTFSSGISVIDGVQTMNFILGDEALENSVIIAGNSSKNVAITVSNQEDISLKYGIYYASLDDLSNVDIGYYHTTEYVPVGVIEGGHNYIVTVRIVNRSLDAKMVTFGLVYGLVTGGDLVISDKQKFLTRQSEFPLNEVEVGSFVQYTGMNGCEEGLCEGKNVNSLITEDKNSFCGDVKNSYVDSGWKVAYIRKGYAYLISAGSPECIDYNLEDENANYKNIDEFIKYLNETSLKYCNVDFAYRGVCDKNSAWNMNTFDFYQMMGNRLNEESCINVSKDISCGFKNSLINNGGYYWLSSLYQNNILYYHPNQFYYTSVEERIEKGIRPVIKMDSGVFVTKGDGTREDPYVISNSKLPDYEYTVVYNGNGATSGDVLDSTHRSNVLKKLNKNQFSLTYQLKLSEIAHFDDSYCIDNGTCYPSSVSDKLTKEAKFLGWSLSMDDKEPIYTDEEEVSNLSHSSSEVVVNLYAVWDYDLYALPSIQERNGYEILGWYTEKDGGEKVGNPGDSIENKDYQNLYARWKVKE